MGGSARGAAGGASAGAGTTTGGIAREQAARTRQQAPEPSARETRRMPGKLTGHPEGRERDWRLAERRQTVNCVKRHCVVLGRPRDKVIATQGDSRRVANA